MYMHSEHDEVELPEQKSRREKGRHKKEVLTVPDPKIFLAEVKTVINIPGFYRTELHDHSRQSYKITVWFRSEMVSFNLSRSEEFLLNVRMQKFSRIM